MRRALRIAVKASMIVLLVLAVAVTAIAGLLIWHYGYEIGLPDHHRVANVASVPVCSDGKRTFVPLANIPVVVRNAFIAAEEPNFYARPPANPFTDIAKAVLFNRMPDAYPSMSVALVGCLVQQDPRCCGHVDGHVISAGSIDRHVVSAIGIYRLERDLPKDAILEAYLNEVGMGRSGYGAAAAAGAHFGKSLDSLSLDEIAFIAALPRAPSHISKTLERGTERRNFVLDRMVQVGAISSAEAEAAKQLPLRLREAHVSPEKRF